MASAGEDIALDWPMKGTTEVVGEYHKVTFVHDGCDYVLGLFNTLDEAHRVCDVLNIKEAVDAMRDLKTLRLHFDLGRYGVDNETAGEIRSVSFRQVVRDLQVCAVEPINGTLGPEETQASSWAYAGGTGMLTSGTRFTDAVEQQSGEDGGEDARGVRGAASAAGERGGGARGGRGRPPGRHARMKPGRSAAASPAPSAALAAFTAAGLANAAAANAEHVQPPASPAIARPLHPPPKFGDAPTQQQEQAGQAQQAQQGEHQQPAGSQQQEQQELRHSDDGAQQQPASSLRLPGRQAAAASKAALKRSRADEDEADQRGEGNAVSRGSGGGGSPPVSAGAAAAALAAVAAAARAMDDDDASLGGIAAARAAGAGQQPQQQQQQEQREEQQPRAEEAAAPPPAARGRAGRPAGRAAKRARREASPAAAAATDPERRPWQQQDVLSFTAAEHPFHGITRLPDGELAAQIALKYSGETVSPGGSKNKTVRFARCSRPAEAAVAWDLAAMWRASQYGLDPASLDADVEAAQRLNFDFRRYADVLPRLRQLATHSELQVLIKALRDDGTLTLVATNGREPEEAAPQPSAVAAVAEPPAAPLAEPAGGSGSRGATPAAQRRATPPGGPFVRSFSGFHGVHGSGPWAAQLRVTVKKVLPERLAAWTVRHREQTLKVAHCRSAELAAACHDLLALWRCTLYGEDPAGPAGAVLNYPMAALAAFRPALPSLTTESVVPHILRLRDDGALQPVLAGGRRTSPPAAPIGGASPPAPTPPRPAAQRRQGAARHTPAVPASPPVELARAAAPTGPSPRALPASPAAPAEGAPAGAAAPAAGTAATAATAAAAPRPAVHPAQAGHAPVQEAGQPERQPADALGGSGTRRADVYPPHELPWVEAMEAMYAEVQARLAAVPQLSQLEVVAYMARFAGLRDMRRTLHQQVKGWSEAGQPELLVQHVRSLLGTL